MYSFQERFNKIISADDIRLFKILEIFEYSFIFFTFTLFLAFLFNKYYYKIKVNQNIKKPTKKQIFYKFIKVYSEVFMLILIFYYTKKIGLLIPSFSSFFNKNFIENTTLEYSIHIAIVVVLIEFIPKFKHNLDELMTLLLKY